MKAEELNAYEANSKGGRDMNPDAFARFLKRLAPDPEEAGRRYAKLHNKLTGFFALKGLTDPASAADETLDRAVMKVEAGAVVPDVDKFCFGIARYIAKERFRLLVREILAFHEFMNAVINHSNEQVERIYEILKPCLELLTIDEQQMLMEYCHQIRGRARAEHRRELAERMNRSEGSVRINVSRLRQTLAKCVQARSHRLEAQK